MAKWVMSRFLTMPLLYHSQSSTSPSDICQGSNSLQLQNAAAGFAISSMNLFALHLQLINPAELNTSFKVTDVLLS